MTQRDLSQVDESELLNLCELEADTLKLQGVSFYADMPALKVMQIAALIHVALGCEDVGDSIRSSGQEFMAAAAGFFKMANAPAAVEVLRRAGVSVDSREEQQQGKPN